MSFTFIIPVYKSSPYVINLLKKIIKFEQEIIVVVDCPEKWFLNELRELQKKYPKLILNISEERRGKVNALNEAIEIARGDYIIFLDADVYDIKIDLNRLKRLFGEYDLIDFAKIYSRNTLLQRMGYYEGLVYNFLLFLRNILHYKVHLVNGAGFAVKREVAKRIKFKRCVAEDVYFSTEAGLLGFRAYGDLGTVVYVEQIKNWKQFIDQRKRWAMFIPELLVRNFDIFIKGILFEPKVLIDLAIYAYPLFLFLIYLIIASYEEKVLLLALLIFSKLSVIYLLLVPFYIYLIAVKITLAFLVTYAIYTGFLYFISKKLEKYFNPVEVLFYVSIFYPVVFAFYISAFFWYPFSKHIKINWKV